MIGNPVESNAVAVQSDPGWIRDNPVTYVTAALRCNLWRKQAEILRAVKDHPRVAVRSCNGSGKTFAAACAVLWWLMAFQENAIAITTAPTERQVKEILWREIRKLYRRNRKQIGGQISQTRLDITPARFALGFSTDSDERFQGFHGENILFVADEASGVSEEIFEGIEASMTSDRARMLLIGNPTSLTGTFYHAFHSRRALWHNIHISAFDTPNLTGVDIVNPALITPKWVEDAEQNWGRESPMYQIRVLGEFPSEAEDTLVPLRLIEAAVARWKQRRAATDPSPSPSPASGEGTAAGAGWGRPAAISGERQSHLPVDGVEIGVDVARFGSDKTVICVRRGDDVVEIESFARQDTMQTAGRVVDAVRRHSPAAVRVDEIGVGAGVVDRLRELGTQGVTGVNVAQRASRPEHFANLRAELYDGLRERFQQGRIAIPDDQALVAELASLKYSFTSSGQVRLEGKEDLRSRGLPSPDRADALMLAFASAARRAYKVWA